MEFVTAIAQWKTALEQSGYSPRTIAEYLRTVKSMEHLAQQKQLSLLDSADTLQNFLKLWRAREQAKLLSGQSSVSQIRLVICALRSFYAALKGPNPATALRIPSAPKRQPRPLADEQIDKLFAALDRSTHEGRQDAVMMWLFYHGLRNSEVRNLRLNDLQVVDGFLAVRFVGKGDVEREVLLVDIAAQELAQWALDLIASRETQQEWLQQLQDLVTDSTDHLLLLLDRGLYDHPKDNRLLFLWNGHQFTRRDVAARFHLYQSKAGLPKTAAIGPHALRHTFATSLLENGVDIRKVQQLMGHASIAQTEGYTKVLRSSKAQAIRHLRLPGGTNGTI